MQHRGASIARQGSGADAPNANAVMEVRNITTTRKCYEPIGESCDRVAHIEFEKYDLTKWQQSASNKHRCIKFRNQEVCSNIENDLAEDRGDEVGQTEARIRYDGVVLV
eukprot:scaffold26270_cov60-Attheya_sp.AAC.8